MEKILHKLKPTQILMLGFALLILAGSFLLNLPISSRNHQSVGFINALFTATSAVCVTGLSVVNTLEQWSIFGKIILITLIQVGGLGFMSLTAILFIIIGKKIGLRERLLIQESLNQSSISGLVRLTKRIVWGTFIVEGIGAIFLSIAFVPMYGPVKGICYGIFHSISAFCNAGFDLVGESSLAPFVSHPLINLTIMLLIICSGLGFGVWFDVMAAIKNRIRYRKSKRNLFERFHLQTKLVLIMTVILLGVGFLFVFVLEFSNPSTMASMPLPEKILAAMFQSVTLRTAGFYTIDFQYMTQGSQFLSLLLMFIGGSPGGTAGGIKTVTICLLFLQVFTTVGGKEEVEVLDRRIPAETVRRALTVIMIALGVVMLVTLTLTVTEDADFMTLAFETVSAFATVGLSMGFTANLTVIGKLVICLTMFIGRLGPVTIAFAMAMRTSKVNKVKKPTGKLMVG